MVYSLSATLLTYLMGAVIGGAMLTLAQRNVRWSINQLLEADHRAPILFLRAFNDDQVPLQNAKLTLQGRAGRWLESVANLDRLLVEEGTPYGPVVAIGNPRDKFPPYGAARGYFDEKTWKSAVADLADDALVIVICLDRTEGIWWEVEHIAKLGYLPKTLFLIHPRFGSTADNRALTDEIAAELKLEARFPPVPRQGAEASGGAESAKVLGFFIDEQSLMHVGGSTTFSRLAFLIQVRWFLRSKLGLAKVAK
jgi:hypothetical protein